MPRQVLILRSCRADVFAAAVLAARQRHPDAVISALTHRGYRDTVQAAGVDRIIEVPGRRFGLLRMMPWHLLRLRASRFDEVVVPRMSAWPDDSVNLYWVVLALKPLRVVVTTPGTEAVEFSLEGFARYTRIPTVLRATRRIDALVFIGILAAACVARRRRMQVAGSRRRILHVISSMGVGGAQVQLAQLINNTPRDYEIDLLVLSRSDGEFSRQWLTRDDVTVSFVEPGWHLVPVVREIRIRCQERQYDIVHTWLFVANMVGAAAARLAGVPLVIGSVRNLSVLKREAWYRQWWHRLGDILGSHAADVVTVNAHALVEDHARWARMSSAGIQVIHNGLDPAHFSYDRVESRRLLLDATGAPADAVLVGTVGRLAHEKDQATFLRILAGVCAARPDVHGVIVGEGELRGSLERLAGDLGIQRNVTFLGARTDARQLAAGLDLFILTSRSEGFPNVLLEAAFMRVPCVATDIAGNPEVLTSEAALFSPGDVDAGIRQVLDLLRHPRRTAAHVEQVYQHALKRFTSERSVSSWLQLYRRLEMHAGSGIRFGVRVAGLDPAPPQVLVLRSCRAEVFVDAVHAAREWYPGAVVSALTHRGHHDTLRAAGVDRPIEIPGRRFGPLRLPPWTLARLRARRFDVVVIPQMTPVIRAYLNVYTLAAALGARCYVVTAVDGRTSVFDRRTFWRHIRQAAFEWCAYRRDTAMFVCQLVMASCLTRRREPSATADRRRRVLHIIDTLSTGGAQVQLAELLNRTPRDRYDVDLLVLNPADGLASRRLFARDDIGVTFLARWPNRTLALLEVVAHCRQGSYHLVHTWNLDSNIIGQAAARLAGVPRVITSVRGMSRNREFWYSEWWWRLLDAMTSWKADVVTVNAHALVEDHARWAWMPASRIHVVHNGLDPDDLAIDRAQARTNLIRTLGVDANAVVIGTAGRLSGEKDQATFLRMLAQLRLSHPEVHGVLVGDGRLRGALEELAVALGLTERVTFLGERADARFLMAGFDLFVLPSLVEGFPNVLLETALLGVPSVATRIAGNPEVLPFETALFPPGDVEACVQRVHAALADPSGTAARVESIRARALQLFTSERSVRTWIDLYDRCLSADADVSALPVTTPVGSTTGLTGER